MAPVVLSMNNVNLQKSMTHLSPEKRHNIANNAASAVRVRGRKRAKIIAVNSPPHSMLIRPTRPIKKPHATSPGSAAIEPNSATKYSQNAASPPTSSSCGVHWIRRVLLTDAVTRGLTTYPLRIDELGFFIEFAILKLDVRFAFDVRVEKDRVVKLTVCKLRIWSLI